MKMVKSLLLGSAAGLVAVAGAQAADLPVKAKPVEYVKVCSLYGAGYYYMPGTDICIKLGGYVRWQISANPGSSITGGPHSGQGGRSTRADSVETAMRTRALITVDTRQQTAYGTLRTYILLGYSQDSTVPETTSPPVYMTRGFIQIAGFTFGKATSFFDVVPGASFAYNAGMFYHPDTGDAGKMLAAYTAQFGNGVSGTIALEQSRNRGVVRHNRNNAPTITGAGGVSADNPYSLRTTTNPVDSTDGGLAKGVSDYPDLVGNIRIDQSWGTWLVGAAARRVQGQYFGSADSSGGPESKIGWAVTTGFVLNLPMIAPGDRLSAGVVYAKGATGYAAVTPSGSFQNKFDGNTVGFGFWEDGIYEGGVTPAACNPAAGCGDIQLTTAFSVSAAFEHLWTPSLKTSLYGSYVAISHGDAGKFLICNSGGTGPSLAASGSVFRPGDPALTGCDPDWSAWNVGSRTQWEPVKGLIMGVDVIYNKLNTAQANFANVVALNSAGNPTYAGAKANGNYVVTDQDSWMGTFRVQRDFLP
jgi:hypothetical protein